MLIFSQFTRMLDILEDYLTAAQYPCERIDGSVSLRDRQAAIDRYTKGAPGCHYEACKGMLPARWTVSQHDPTMTVIFTRCYEASRARGEIVQPAALCGSHRACAAVMACAFVGRCLFPWSGVAVSATGRAVAQRARMALRSCCPRAPAARALR